MREIADNPRVTFRGRAVCVLDRGELLDALDQALLRVRELERKHEHRSVSDDLDDDFWGVNFK